MRPSLATLCLSFAVAVAPIASLADIAGLREGHMPAPHHGRDMAYALWYTAQAGANATPHFGNPVFQPILAAMDATPAGGRYPLVLLSHGLGGLRGNLAGYAAACTLRPTRHCDDIARAGVDLAQLDATLWEGDHSDSRIGRVAAIDPGLTYGLTAQDAAGLRVPTLLVQLGAGTDRLDATDISAQGSNLTALLPSATLVQIAPAAHFSVLPLCTAQGAAILRDEGDDPVCTDPDGALRAETHAQVLTAMRAHLGLD